MKEKWKHSFWFNFLIVLLIATVLYISFFITLSYLTRHSEEIVVPKVIGKDMNAAINTMHAMTFEVLVDSTYEPKFKPLTVLKQMPDSGAGVKMGRTVFITVNKTIPPQTPMPDLAGSGLSFRSAEMMLRNNKLILGDTIHKPYIAKEAVMEQRFKGKEILAGTMIAMGSKIDLVIGDGLGITQFNVPDVIGMTTMEGSALLSGNGLVYAVITEGVITDTASAIIYDQSPRPKNELLAPNRIKAGDFIDLRVKQTATSEEIENNRNGGRNVIPKDSVKDKRH
jgi:beta-lactam-binding protein with PASTA domain